METPLAGLSNARARRYDVLLSYAPSDEPFAMGVLEQGLKSAGVRVHHRGKFEPGRPILAELERAVEDCEFIVAVLSPAYISDELATFERILAQHLSLDDQQRRVIPLLYRAVEVPPLLRVLHGLDCTDRESWDRCVEKLCEAAGRPGPKPPERPECPYPGMRPFGEGDSQVFFGRQTEASSILAKIALERTVLLVGPSGCGKSSLVFAGVIPLLGSSTHFHGTEWVTRAFRPGRDPGDRLAETIEGSTDDALAAVSRMLQAHDAGGLLLVVDQLEELFTVADGDQTQFIEAMSDLISLKTCAVVATMRAEFYGDLMTSGLWQLFAGHEVRLLPLDRESLEAAISEPARAVDVYVEAELTHKLVDDAGGEPGMMPLVQETLRELWDHLEWRFLPLSAYVLPRTSYGDEPRTGLHRALDQHADAAFARLDPERQQIATRIFIRLVHTVAGRGTVRRQRTVDQLEEVDQDPAVVRTTIAELTEARILTTGSPTPLPLPREPDTEEPAALSSEATVDLAHEALIEGWARLGSWIDQLGKAEADRLRLEAKANEWLELERRGGLLDDIELAAAEQWRSTREAQRLGIDRTITELIDASREALTQRAAVAEAARQRQLLIRNRWIAVVSAVALVAAISAVVAFGQRSTAERRATETKAVELAAVASQLADQSLDLALLLSIEAHARQSVPEATSTLVTTLARAPSLVRILHGHDEEVRAVAATRDGLLLASASRDETIVVWDASGQQLQRLQGHTDEVHGLAFSPDGSVLVSSSNDQTIRRWNPVSGKQIGSALRGHTGNLRGVAVDPSGRWIASASHDHTVRLWDLETGEEQDPFDDHTHQVLDVAFDNGGTRLASAGRDGPDGADGLVIVRDLSRPGDPLKLAFDTPARAVAFHPRVDTMLVVALNDGTARLWDLTDPDAPPEVVAVHGDDDQRILDAHAHRILDVVFSPDGRYLATASRDQSIRVWDVANRELKRQLDGHSGDVRSVAFMPSGSELVSGGRDGKVMIWDIDQAPRLTHVGSPTAPAVSVQYSADGTQVSSVGDGGLVEILDAASGDLVSSVQLRDFDDVAVATFAPQGDQLAIGSTTGTVGIWDVRTGDPTWGPFGGHSGEVRALAFDLDEARLVSGGTDARLVVWDATTGRSDLPLEVEFAISDVTVGFNADSLIATDVNGTLWGWRLDSESPERRQIADNQIRSLRLAMSPDGDHLVVGTSQDRLAIWRLDAGLPSGLATTIDHRGAIDQVATDAAGRIAALDEGNNRVTLWDLATGRGLGVLPLEQPTRLTLSPTGSSLAVATAAGIEIWDLSIANLLAQACSVANRNLTDSEWSFYVGGNHEESCPGLEAPS